MRWLSRFRRRAAWDDDLREELEAYLAQEADDNVARGMTIEAARAAARRKLGNRTAVQEAMFDMRTFRPLDALRKDVTYGVRVLRRAPGFTLAAILSLALGIGANTAIFQLLDAVRLRTLPVDRPEEIVEISPQGDGGRIGQFVGRNSRTTNPIWEQIRDRQQAFSGVFAWGDTVFNLAPTGEVRQVPGLWVSGSFFEALGVRPAFGRFFTPADDRHGCGMPGAVISYAFWQRELGGSRDVLARTLTISRHHVPILGVTPPGFFGVEVGRGFDVALPLCSRPVLATNAGLDRRDLWWLTTMGRLKPGWTIERANADLASLSPSVFQSTLPPSYREGGAKEYLALRLRAESTSAGVSGLRDTYERPLIVLMSIVGLVLLVACANLANLMLARASAREREFAVRLAIGASRTRVVAQLLVESLLLAAIGAAAGVLLAQWLTGALVAFLSSPLDPVALDLSLGWRTLAFTMSVACLTCVIFGLTPALAATRRDVSAAMRSAGRGTVGRERFSLRRALVVSQIAFSLLLIVGALLFVRSLRNLTTLDTGYRTEGVLVVGTSLPREDYPVERRVAKHREVLDRLRGIPGVTDAAQVFNVPFSGAFWNPRVFADGVRETGRIVSMNQVSGGYFRAMGMPIKAGRDFDERDTRASPYVAIVNERLAREMFKGGSPIGRTLHQEMGAGEADRAYQIIGLVGDAKVLNLREEIYPSAFITTMQEENPALAMRYVLRGRTDIGTLTVDVKRTMERTDPSIGLRFTRLQTEIDRSLLRERLMATLSGGFGILASVLAVVGLYGLVAYMVARRQAEIGVRLALGATGRDVVRLILGEAVVLLTIGLALGLPLTLAAGRSARTLLFGLEPHDPTTIAIAVLLLASAGLLATAWPARRASRTDPVSALRES